MSKIVAVSFPIIFNNSQATYYTLGSPQYPTGQGVSYGVNINYSRFISSNFYGVVGIGYLKQVFGISRPFHFSSPFEPIYHTKTYNYSNIHLSLGIGYRKQLYDRLGLKAEVSFNSLHSYRQKYKNKENQIWQVNKKSFFLGSMVNVAVGLEHQITPKISFGTDVLFPIIIKWKDDEIFFKYDGSDDSQQIARNKFSIGAVLLVKYHF